MYDLGLPEDATRTVVLATTRPRSYLVAEVESWHVEVLLHLRPYCQVRRRRFALHGGEDWGNGCCLFLLLLISLGSEVGERKGGVTLGYRRYRR